MTAEGGSESLADSCEGSANALGVGSRKRRRGDGRVRLCGEGRGGEGGTGSLRAVRRRGGVGRAVEGAGVVHAAHGEGADVDLVQGVA